MDSWEATWLVRLRWALSVAGKYRPIISAELHQPQIMLTESHRCIATRLVHIELHRHHSDKALYSVTILTATAGIVVDLAMEGITVATAVV